MTPESQSQPVLILGSVAAASVVLASGLPPLTPDRFDWIGPAVGLVGLVATAILTVLTRARVVPIENVAVRRLPMAVDPETLHTDQHVGTLVAEQGMPGIPNGAEVDVTRAGPTPYGGA